MKFYDEVKVFVQSGAGGNGCVSFRREKFVPRGGPNGGDGGDGGGVIFVADSHRKNLIDLYYQRHYRAERGEHGSGSDRYGKGAKDLVVHVPVGTLVHDAATGDLLADLTEEGREWVAAPGGKGGRGNMHFATPTNRAPRKATPGRPGEERWLRVELKLIAEVGLLGFPNAGKSTFVGAVTRARPKIADYPFTTLTPQLGMVDADGARRFVVADIPGIIEGASEGAGLGLRFLKHIERNRLLLHLVDLDPGNGRDPARDFAAINAELAAYGRGLPEKPQIVAANKLDLEGADERLAALRRALPADVPVHGISAATGRGVPELLAALRRTLEALDALTVEPPGEAPGEPVAADAPPAALQKRGRSRRKARPK
jgi:GTP-binding protein